MTPFHCFIGMKYPSDQVAKIIRDHLSELAGDLDDVDTIQPVERALLKDGSLTLVNEWRVRPKIPDMLGDLVDSTKLGWLDTAHWLPDGTACTWRIDPFFMPGAIRCAGSTRFEPAMGGRGVRVSFEGKLEIESAAFQAVPASLRSAATKGIESLVSALIPKNFRKTTDAVARHLA
jgi:hypothetical protein